MQTNFTLAQLADADVRESEKILRACVHCGFCNATCPTYVLLGDELDSPRGRIYLIKDMLENERPATAEVVKHIDRCLSCLACMTTCPSAVHYQHLVDHGRRYIEQTYRRPWPDRALRLALALVLPRPWLFRPLLHLARILRPLAGLVPGPLGGVLELVPLRIPKPSGPGGPGSYPAEGERKKRVALLAGCVQCTLAPAINEATIRLLRRHGCEVLIVKGTGCCGAIGHHLGREKDAHRAMKANIEAWTREAEGDGLDAIIINASGCGTMVKDYGFILRQDERWAARAEAASALARDIGEFIAEIGLAPPMHLPGLKVAYQSACSLRHGQGVETAPIALLEAAGFEVGTVPEGHLCCGSAGTYNLLQPDIAKKLLARKVQNIESVSPEVIATGNVGCQVQIGGGTAIPVVHTVELLDWATGGPKPEALIDAAGSGGKRQ
ncbi:MAG: glycolate oxidase subunit GlcF [Alphaproteobacteria bacterium]|nr:glycolate oxidase subunit GlcF [Alphaproteobacteria bacterium]